ncbi:Cytochrome p450 [Neofusicoccum parvum]|nr:Cytochrome p450 [Neofusicoccum parvum]
MPKLRRPLAKPLTGVPGRLMSCMRSLAGVQEFDVYLSRGGVELELQAIRSILNQDVVGTPELDVHATYKGGFGGGKNLWQSYPCEEDGNLPWNPLVDDEPASYEKAAMREDIPTSPSAILKETRLRLRKKPTSDESSDGLAWRVRPSPEIELVRPTNTEPKRLPVTYSHKRKVSEAISDYEEQHLGKRDTGATTQEKVKPTQEKAKPASAAIRTISASHQDPAGTQAYRHISNPAPHRDTTGVNNPSITTAERNIEPSAARRTTAATARTPPPDPPAHTTPYYRRRASSPPALPPSPPDHDAAPPLHLRAAVLDCLRARAGTAAASQPPSDLSSLHTPHLFLELSEFLAAATRLDPRAHDTHREPLLALGAAARSGDVAAFDAAMGMCQREVVREAWGAGQELLGECFVLLDWLNGSVCRVAGTLMLGVLVGLGDVGEVHWGSEEWTGELARVRATAFWAFG